MEKKLYIKPSMKMLVVRSCTLLDSSNPENHQVNDALSKRHNGFWADMEESASSWPKSHSVWDD